MNKPKPKFCADCNNFMDVKPEPLCKASKYPNLVTGQEKRTCSVERLDGIGRCGMLGNNFVALGSRQPKAKERGVPEKPAKQTKKKVAKK